MKISKNNLSSDAEKTLYKERDVLQSGETEYLGFEHEGELVCTTQQLAFYLRIGVEVIELHAVLEYSENKTAFKDFVDTLEVQNIYTAQ